MAAIKKTVFEILSQIPTPGTQVSLVESGAVRNVDVEGNDVVVTLALSAQNDGFRQQVVAALRTIDDIGNVSVEVQVMLGMAPPPKPGPEWAHHVKDIGKVIAVASGKGGVGKSTVSSNLALALAKQGYKVGLLDADIYGPSQQMMMGATTEPSGGPDGKIHPVIAPGDVKVMSFGYIIDVDQPVIWRGPMLMKALEQFFGDVLWGELDYLIVDMPPGTGDVALTLCQNVPLAGAVIVTTPQDVALIDARKGLHMFRKLDIKVLGIIENMSFFECPECHHVEHIFGTDGGKRTANDLDIPFLGAVPLEAAIVSDSDQGKPVVRSRPESAAALAFTKLASTLSAS